MKKNRLILIVLYIVVLSVMVVSLSACGLFNKKDKSDQPTITAFYVQKASYNYEGSKEEAFNSATTLDVCVDDNETYNLVVKYNNKSKYSISYVKINGERYNPASFATGSNTSVTYIPFKTAEQADTEDIPYTLSAVYFVDGTSTTKMSWSKDVDKTSTVIVRVRPEFNVTLNYMNQDFRVATATDGAVVQTTKSYYNSDFSNILQSPIYETGTGMPVKEGGWIFVGWFTKPNGEGTLISEKEKYYFWTNMTFYAHYERMYELEVVELDEPIEYTYGNSRKVFSSGVKVVNHTFDDEWSKYQALVIPDTVTIESTTYTTTYDEYNVPVFKPTTTSVEYPVIAIDNNAFRAFNTIVTVSIGRYIESIGYCAFQDCTGMTTFNFPSNTTVKYIGDYAFEKTSALGVSPPFTLPETVEYLGNFAFRYSGWATTRNAGSSSAGESVLHIKSNWKYVGYKCFFNTNFETVIFDPGCYFSGQISSSEGSALESASGYRQFQKESNLIGASLFADCLKLRNVQFKSDKDVENALNIIPDACFDLFSWTSNATKIQYVAFSEGLKYIGSKAFYYQQAIEKLELPASLEEIDTFAFYECEKVNTLTFGDDATHDSQLQILHSSCFGNLIDLDSCTITSSVFARYGSGIFRGCDRLKCVIFENLEVAPTGYRANEVMENGKDVEVVPYHYQADFLYATGEAGDAGSDDGTTYSSPLRVFCKSELVNEFKEELLLGKEVHAGSTSSNTSAFSSSVFVHPLENIVEYTYMYDGTEYTVDVAYQEVYAADANGKATTTVLGYSLVYWGARSDYVVLPEASDLNTNKDVFEIAMFSMPTSVQYIYVPSSYTRIEHDAFNGCQVLSNVEFEDINTLEYIGDYAFFGTAISSFTAGTNLKVIGQYAFSRCNALQWVDLYESQIHSVKDTEGKIDGTSYTTVRTIYVYKYEYELSDNDKDYSDFLGNSCFAQDANLIWVRLPQDIKQLSTGLFNGCRNMTEVIIPTDVISSETSASSDYTFYQYGTPASIYNAQTMHSLTLYVSTDAMNTHKIVYSEGTYSVISSWNDPRSNN